MMDVVTKKPASPDFPWLHKDRQFQFLRWGKTTVWPEGVKLTRDYFQRVVTDYTFWFIHEGEGTLTDHLCGKTYEVTTGSCLIMQPGIDFEVATRPAVLATYFHWDIPHYGTPSNPYPPLPLPSYYTIADVAYYTQATQHLVDILNRSLNFPDSPEFEQMHLAAESLLKSLLLETSVEVSRPRKTTHYEMTLTKMATALQEDPRRFRSTAEMAAYCGYSTSHFRAVCLKILGETPSAILIRSRIAHAKSYLYHTNLSVGMIAEAIGYENIYYFSSQFREITGMSPTEYRQTRS